MTTRNLLAALAAVLVSAPVASARAQGAGQEEAAPRGRSITELPADQPVFPARAISRPVLSIEGGAGMVGYVSGAGRLGPAWNARVTAHLSNRFALEGNYLGSFNTRVDDGSQGLLMTAVDAAGRFNILPSDQPFVQPYVSAGVGYAAFAGPDGDLGTVTLPVALGAERMITPAIKAGVRLSYRPAFFDHLGRDYQDLEEEPGGDTWALVAHLGGAF